MADLPNKPVEAARPAPERAGTPEAGSKPAERRERVPAGESSAERESVPSGAAPSAPVRRATAPAAPPAKDPVVGRIEDVLSEDLTDAFLAMSPKARAEFKAKGEETAGQIRAILDQAKVNARKIFDLIRGWLKMIPGVNRFFLEQEAKIKTDKILRLKP